MDHGLFLPEIKTLEDRDVETESTAVRFRATNEKKTQERAYTY